MFVPAERHARSRKFHLRVDAPEHVTDVARILRTVLARVHHGAADYEVLVPRELLKQRQQTQHILNMVLGSIAGISLLVGGIGIMNIMLATVTERTREIGIRRAIGRKSAHDFAAIFNRNRCVLTIVGGLFGIIGGTSAGPC